MPWRPLGQLLVDEGLLTPEQLEAALDNQATTGRRLGEIAVEFGFVSHMALSRVLSAQYGVELNSETGFGTGLRAELERRADHEDDVPGSEFLVALRPLELAPALTPPSPHERRSDLEDELEALRQTSEYGHEEAARLSEALSAKETEHAALSGAYDRRQAQAIKFATAMRERDRLLAGLENELAQLHEVADELAQARGALEHTDREAELLAEALTERDRELADLRGSSERRHVQATKFATRLRSDRNQVAQLQYELTQLRDGTTDSERQAVELAEAVRERDDQLAGGHQELTALRAEYDRRHTQAAKFATALRANDARVTELEKDLAAVREVAKHRYEDAQRLGDELSAGEGRIAELEEELANLRDAAEQGNGETSKLVEDLAETLREREGSIAALEGELAALGQASEQGYDEVAQLAEALSARDHALAARERELDTLHRAYDRRYEQATRLAQRARRRSGAREDDGRDRDAADGYLVLAPLARRYALVEREGALPSQDATLELPDVGAGTLRVVGIGPSPLPNDVRSCVFTERMHESV